MSLVLVEQETQLPEHKRERLEKQQYRLVGNHSAVKICMWCKESIRGKAECYKNDFYGIPSHQCLEMSPAITCNKRCKHCWRDTSVFSTGWVGPVDEPKDIVDNCIGARYKLLLGFGGHPSADRNKVEESFVPKHAAISLTGEPMMYPRYPELIKEFFSRGFTTVFAVTSGTVPETIRALDIFPTNIYLSVEAWDKEMYTKYCIPVIPDAWEKFLESAALLKSAKTRTIMRITCMKGINMDAPEKFRFLVDIMQPDVIECKAYAWMGYSRQRLLLDNAPDYGEVDAFARRLMFATNYEIALSKVGSDVVMLRRKTPRIVDCTTFIYEGLDKEKLRQQQFVKEIVAKLEVKNA
ncbi:4-demethylwyosine synthase TYW1 [Candidatus Woesearchaeota archaeon]|nr:4-demethylwyosine synthase TYW1 [Candidatus Woesearchaeota archaeon]